MGKRQVIVGLMMYWYVESCLHEVQNGRFSFDNGTWLVSVLSCGLDISVVVWLMFIKVGMFVACNDCLMWVKQFCDVIHNGHLLESPVIQHGS